MKKSLKAKKTIDMDTKAAKYFVAQRIKGMSKSRAVKEAGISDVRNVAKFENSQTYLRLEEKYRDHMLKHIGLDETAEEHTKVIKQDKDLGAKMNAIKLFLERVEPEAQEQEENDKMIVVLRA